MKNVAKSSAVRVDEGGGRGQRREENVLKSMRELEEIYVYAEKNHRNYICNSYSDINPPKTVDTLLKDILSQLTRIFPQKN